MDGLGFSPLGYFEALRALTTLRYLPASIPRSQVEVKEDGYFGLFRSPVSCLEKNGAGT